ncbi:WD domain G-beta repeat [Carpediemonas membranifera]|uniref:WD domain G-beta repeat n=1 Tax=Carpediemonas membranifera TaxID=201153 RepID=A0A8J6APB1_9EUKA|nr:WD domain G-beta repeat [Carpediemonas membranifera]|eukprot:KAG9389701.1 WD domain G-beta repeat [Carpediemonas membranifera]
MAPTAEYIVTGSSNGDVQFISIGLGTVLCELPHPEDSVTCLAIGKTHDGTTDMLAVGFHSGRVFVYDCTNLNAVVPVTRFTENVATATCVAFYFGQVSVMLAVGCEAPGRSHHPVLVYAISPSPRLKFELQNHESPLTSVLFTPNKWLLSGDQAGRVVVGDVAHEAFKLKREILHQAPIYDIGLHPSERVVAVSSGDRTIRFWDLNSRETAKWCSAGKTPRSDSQFPKLHYTAPAGQYVLGLSPHAVLTWTRPPAGVREATLVSTVPESLGEVLAVAGRGGAEGQHAVFVLSKDADRGCISLWRLPAPGSEPPRRQVPEPVLAPLRVTTAMPESRARAQPQPQVQPVSAPEPTPPPPAPVPVAKVNLQQTPTPAPPRDSPFAPADPEDDRPPFDPNPLPDDKQEEADPISKAIAELEGRFDQMEQAKERVAAVSECYQMMAFNRMFSEIRATPAQTTWLMFMFLTNVDFRKMSIGVRDLVQLVPLLTPLFRSDDPVYVEMGLSTMARVLETFTPILARMVGISEEGREDPAQLDKYTRAMRVHAIVQQAFEEVAEVAKRRGNPKAVRDGLELVRNCQLTYETTVVPV